jgi:hypothetical protein
MPYIRTKSICSSRRSGTKNIELTLQKLKPSAAPAPQSGLDMSLYFLFGIAWKYSCQCLSDMMEIRSDTTFLAGCDRTDLNNLSFVAAFGQALTEYILQIKFKAIEFSILHINYCVTNNLTM